MNIFNEIEGLQEVDPKKLQPFLDEMEERIIPAIIEAVKKREILAEIHRLNPKFLYAQNTQN